MVDVSNRRAVMLDPPPFIVDRRVWAHAVSYLRENRATLPGEAFIVACDVYRKLGGDFR
jgi:hypothetical protein